MKITRPHITGDFERLDIKKYEQIGTLTQTEMWDEDEDSSIYYTTLDYSNYENGITFRLTGTDRKSGYYSKETADSSFIQVAKNYYPNGKIKYKRLSLNYDSNFHIGRGYRFNEDGDLIYAVDNDSCYDFQIEDVLMYLMEIEKLPLKPGFLKPGEFRIRINRIVEVNEYPKRYVKPFWKIEWKIWGDEKDPMRTDLVLDGKTGEVISRTEQKMEYSHDGPPPFRGQSKTE